MTTFTTQDRQDAQRVTFKCTCGHAIGHPLVSKCTCKKVAPLSEFEIKGILAQGECWIGEDSSMPNLIAFARAIERAHGIGE